MLNYLREFPDFADEQVPSMPSGFHDESWKNDVCPSWKSDALGLRIWVECADPSKREFPEWERFSVCSEDAYAENTKDLFASNDWQAVLDFVHSYARSMLHARTNEES